MKELLKTEVNDSQQVLSLSAVRDRYVCELDAQGAPSPYYKSLNLMSKLEKDDDLGKHLFFSKVALKERGCFSFWLVYSTSITLADAIACAYQLGTADQLKDTALYLRQVIHKAYEEVSELTWPPTAEELDKQAGEELPEELTRFLNLVLCGSDSMVEKCEKTE